MVAADESAAKILAALADDLRQIDARMTLPDGDVVTMPVALWAHEWLQAIADMGAAREEGTGAHDFWICCRCLDEVDELVRPLCASAREHPGIPMGQYHCPDCGAMCVAGVPHGFVCRPCRDQQHPRFDGASE